MAKTGGPGVQFSVNGEPVFETEEPVARVSIRGEQGELAAFATTDIHDLNIVVEYEGVLNQHLRRVEREQRNVRREEAKERIARRNENAESASERTPAFSGTPTNEE